MKHANWGKSSESGLVLISADSLVQVHRPKFQQKDGFRLRISSSSVATRSLDSERRIASLMYSNASRCLPLVLPFEEKFLSIVTLTEHAAASKKVEAIKLQGILDEDPYPKESLIMIISGHNKVSAR